MNSGDTKKEKTAAPVLLYQNKPSELRTKFKLFNSPAPKIFAPQQQQQQKNDQNQNPFLSSYNDTNNNNNNNGKSQLEKLKENNFFFDKNSYKKISTTLNDVKIVEDEILTMDELTKHKSPFSSIISPVLSSVDLVF